MRWVAMFVLLTLVGCAKGENCAGLTGDEQVACYRFEAEQAMARRATAVQAAAIALELAREAEQVERERREATPD